MGTDVLEVYQISTDPTLQVSLLSSFPSFGTDHRRLLTVTKEGLITYNSWKSHVEVIDPITCEVLKVIEHPDWQGYADWPIVEGDLRRVSLFFVPDEESTAVIYSIDIETSDIQVFRYPKPKRPTRDDRRQWRKNPELQKEFFADDRGVINTNFDNPGCWNFAETRFNLHVIHQSDPGRRWISKDPRPLPWIYDDSGALVGKDDTLGWVIYPLRCDTEDWVVDDLQLDPENFYPRYFRHGVLVFPGDRNIFIYDFREG
jgi:hypothetical protein